jgi:hypothetical protein
MWLSTKEKVWLLAVLIPVVVAFVVTPSRTFSVAAIETVCSSQSSSATPIAQRAIALEASHADGVGLPQSGGRLIYADRYSNFANALAAATGNTLVINTAMPVSTPAVVTATTKLRLEGGGRLQMLVTRFSSNRYRNNKADDGILLESTGTSVVDAGDVR